MVFTSAGSASGTHDQLGFVTADLAGHVAQMRGSGVVFEDFPGTSDGIADFGPVRAAWFRDVAGRARFRLHDQVKRWPPSTKSGLVGVTNDLGGTATGRIAAPPEWMLRRIFPVPVRPG